MAESDGSAITRILRVGKAWGPNPIYYWYYTTQVMFHAGGGTWNNWNRQFSRELVKNQIVIKDAIADLNGKIVDIGYWKPASPGGIRPEATSTTPPFAR